jgi:hypothetical protein
MYDSHPYAISPIVAVITSTLAISYIAFLIVPSIYSFSTVSNMCYIVAGYQREWLSMSAWRSSSALLGLIAASPLVYVFLGSSSLAFHSKSVMNSPAHSFDILFGWILVMHVCYVCLAIALLGFLHTVKSLLRPLLSISFIVSIVFVMINYESVYNHQLVFFVITGSLAAICGGWCRFTLSICDEQTLPACFSMFIAVIEIVVSLTGILAAAMAQCEILGVRYTRESNPQHYDFYHGQWHALLALVTALLYSRAAVASRLVGGQEVCVSSLPILDWAALFLILIYSIVLIILKEARVDLNVSKLTLGVLLVFFCVHAVFTCYHALNTRKWSQIK